MDWVEVIINAIPDFVGDMADVLITATPLGEGLPLIMIVAAALVIIIGDNELSRRREGR